MPDPIRFQVLPVPAFKDNYIWVLRDERSAAVVDPGDAQPVLDYLARERLDLVAILATHHHPDHVGGVERLKRDHDVPVYGPRDEPIPQLTHPLAEGDRIAIAALGAQFEVLDVPGHTRAHIAYYGSKLLFCGDTLFACGCGRVFEGTPPQLHASLEKLAALPDDTLVYCAHEYTLANIRFARRSSPATRRSPSASAPTPAPASRSAPQSRATSAARRRPTRSCAAPSPRSPGPPAATAAPRSPARWKSSPRSGSGRTGSRARGRIHELLSMEYGSRIGSSRYSVVTIDNRPT